MPSAWACVCGMLAAGSVIAWWLPTPWLDWQPALAWAEPWRWVSAAWVHWSPLHLGANLLAVAVVAALGGVARLPAAAALAVVLAWPLTHLGLLMQPALAHYGGASGVVHAAVAAAACWLVAGGFSHKEGRGGARTRTIGVAIAAGLAVKVLLEAPWAGPLAYPRGWDIATAPLAHASGALAGAVCSIAVGLGLRVMRGRGRAVH